ncbi:MAG: hypothetical protein A3I66_14325 [Burkholderiales bacterium RIFCSPLOWO2_02_FULL_57_36]|nr:MAG: hypothetical protein A3I66_14325 [Burkholderiales bacterium RIFCSPLOWO2_02_FULL_57_36]
MSNTDYMLPTDLVEQLAQRIEAGTGLSFAGNKTRDLRSAVHRMAASTGIEHAAECADWLLSGSWDRAKADLCASHLTVGETYFFREPRAFGLVRDYARDKIKTCGAANARLRIWSAGCCTGEEPYSIAMALNQHVPELDPSQLSILGTDINSGSLEIARDGVYRHWSFRNTDAALQKSNFSEEGEGKFRLSDRIKGLVKFSELNLAAPVYPSVTTDTHAMDIIFCRNVLMYFSRAQALIVIERFRQCLVNGGWLIVSPSEASSELFAGFSGLYYPDAIYFKKKDPLDVPIVAQPRASSAGNVGGQADDMQPERRRAAAAATHPRAKPAQTAAAPRGLNKTMEDAPASRGFYHARALAAIETGDQPGAQENLRRVLYLQPDSIIGHYLMGVVRFTQGRQREATRQFSITMRLLAPLKDDGIVPESEGCSAAYLRVSARSFLQKGGV